MSKTIPHLLIAALLLLPGTAGAGEIVKKTITKSDGSKVSGYVYRSNSSRARTSSYSRSNRYPAYRSHGYTYAHSRGYLRHHHGCRSSRPAVQTTRTNITYNAACPITIGARHHRHSSGVTVFRRR